MANFGLGGILLLGAGGGAHCARGTGGCEEEVHVKVGSAPTVRPSFFS